jgi:predicted MFS family arabinose efflux permease
VLEALRVRDFRLLWAARLLSNLGSWLLVVAVPLYVFDLTGSTAATGAATVAETLPALLAGPVAGVLVDRWQRRRTMIVADLVRAGCVLALLLVARPERLWILYLAVVCENLAWQFFAPARQALVPMVVGRGRGLADANALDALAEGAIRLAGAPLGGLLYASLGIRAVVLADAATYLLSAAGIAMVATRSTRSSRPTGPTGPTASGQSTTGAAPTDSADSTSPAGPALGSSSARASIAGGPVAAALAELREGASWIAREATLRGLLMAGVVFLAANGALTALFVPFVRLGLHGGARELGLLLSALGAGYLVGGPLAPRLLDRLSDRVLAAGLLAITGGAFLALFELRRLAFDLPMLALVGVCGAGFLVVLQTQVQRRTPDALLGRVGAAFLTAQTGATVAGAATAVVLGQGARLGVALDLGAGGVLLAAVSAALLLPRSSARPTRLASGLDESARTSLR